MGLRSTEGDESRDVEAGFSRSGAQAPLREGGTEVPRRLKPALQGLATHARYGCVARRLSTERQGSFVPDISRVESWM